MPSKISLNKPGSYLLLNGDEAVARGAIEAGVKLAASYPGTPSTEILEAIADVAKKFGIHAEWSINEIVALEVAAGSSMAGLRSIVSMKHVGLNVASDAAMTLAYTGVIGGLVIAVCDDPAMHSSQNEQDTRYFSPHSDLPLFDAGNPQEAKDMIVEAFEMSERLELPVIVRLTTRVAHGKGKVKIGAIKSLSRKAAFDKDPKRWVMVPSNSIKRHRVLKQKLRKAKELVNKSKFNLIEDNKKEIGIVGSGIGYYYARSVVDTSMFSWLKLGLVYPFPLELFKKFSANIKKIFVIEELKPYVENQVKYAHPEVLGKQRLGLNEIGEFSPDILKDVFVRLGLSEKLEIRADLELPSRPPVLCPSCPHRAFFYALNSARQFVNCDPKRCVGCVVCEYACSLVKEKTFNPGKSRIKTIRLNPLSNIAVACRVCEDPACIQACPEGALIQSEEKGVIRVDEAKCNGCGWCIESCEYGALTLHSGSGKIIVCDTCDGEPACIKWCPESALSLKGKNKDKIVTGDIGCYTLGFMPPVEALQSCLCMGAGISQAAGMFHAGVEDKVFAVIGDSTFFHAGIPGLLNIAYNQANVCVVILDNRVVAMTGHQPTPGSGINALGEKTKMISIKDITRAVGIEKVEVVDPYDLRGTQKVIRDILDYNGPSVIISERPCPLRVEKGKIREISDECNSCGVCVEAFGCPAISINANLAEIDPTLCYGCGVCEQVCPFDVIRSKEQ
ncbi:MAG: thiamine pyrophosphate-dependent enzyme [Candidatus Bathyarchaeota archaeon]|nr:thiamine pyrophosphate-dependent enzyme [Candidatus Bathyarchaeota archaeon]